MKNRREQIMKAREHNKPCNWLKRSTAGWVDKESMYASLDSTIQLSIEDMHDEVTSMRQRLPEDGLVIDDYEDEFVGGFISALEFLQGYYDNLGEIFSCRTPDLYSRSYSKPESICRTKAIFSAWLTHSDHTDNLYRKLLEEIKKDGIDEIETKLAKIKIEDDQIIELTRYNKEKNNDR